MESLSDHYDKHLSLRCGLLFVSLAGRRGPTREAFRAESRRKRSFGGFLAAGIGWVFEVIPIGITNLVIGVLQLLFHIRPANEAFKDFMDSSVMFVFASIVIGMVFTKTELTRRLAYKSKTWNRYHGILYFGGAISIGFLPLGNQSCPMARYQLVGYVSRCELAFVCRRDSVFRNAYDKFYYEHRRNRNLSTGCLGDNPLSESGAGHRRLRFVSNGGYAFSSIGRSGAKRDCLRFQAV